MSKRILCPYCFNAFKNTDVLCQCENNEVSSSSGEPFCPMEEDVKLSDYRNVRGLMSKHLFPAKTPLFKSVPQPTKCDRCGAESTRFVCPHCHNAIPREMVEEGSEIISIIGAPSSGKTIYFTSLINALNTYGYKVGLSVRAKDETKEKENNTTNIYSNLRSDLFEDGILPSQTPKRDRSLPLIFKLTSSVEAFKYNKDDKSIYLVFYDTAGESFTSEQDIKDNVKYLKESSGIILLLDPFSVPKLREIFKKAGQELQPSRGDVGQVLDILRNIRDDKKGMTNKPLAITFSKIDAVVNGLDALGEQGIQGIDLTRDSRFLETGVFDNDDINQNDKALQAYCENWEIAQKIGDAATSFSNYKLFGISSLGTAPDADDPTHVTDIKPYRVMDPLVWILTQMKGFHIKVK